MQKFSLILFLIILGTAPFFSSGLAFAQTPESELFKEAQTHFSKGEYKEAITLYDEILEKFPNNISTLNMKGIALSNLGYHEQSLKQFYKVFQIEPNNVLSLSGMGVGFGYLGEYSEAKFYFEKALKIKPQSTVLKNYNEFVDRVIEKYPYKPTQKPENPIKVLTIPDWVKQIAKWWSLDQIDTSEFTGAISFLISQEIIQVPYFETNKQDLETMPLSIKENTELWADSKIKDSEFIPSIEFMIQNGFIKVDIEKNSAEQKRQNEEDYRLFERYLNQISRNVVNEKRYIEFPNPSADVIKKFLRDYVKWNFEEEAKSAAGHFPNPEISSENGTIIVDYKIFVNAQPTGLPLDHVSTLNESLEFWENQELSSNGDKAKVRFSYTNDKNEANVWVTWVVRNLGEGLLGHAHIGKGIVEVALGDYYCDGSFQLFDVNTVKLIMTHELGHSIGLGHSSDKKSIMYPSLNQAYAYCLLEGFG